MKNIALLVILIICSLPMIAKAETTTFKCHYSSYSDEQGNHKAEQIFDLIFMIDLDNKKTYIIGNNGTEEVMLVPNSEGYSFLEVTPSGNLMTTAIDNNLKSVHSRNTIINGLVATQYYGTCIIQ